MIRGKAIAFGVLVEALAILAANFVSLPSAVLWIGVALALATGLTGGLVAGRFVGDGWRARGVNGLLAGLVGGALFGVTLWSSMSYVIPRAERSAFWGINYALAAHPIGIRQFPWLYTGNTLMLPFILLSMALFAGEGYVAGVAARTRDSSRDPPTTLR